jgi:hypothetical protein
VRRLLRGGGLERDQWLAANTLIRGHDTVLGTDTPRRRIGPKRVRGTPVRDQAGFATGPLVRSVATAQTTRHAAPSAVVQFAAARARMVPLSGTT